MSTHYIAVLVPKLGGGWSVLFPDLPGCATQGETVHEALAMAGEAAGGWIAVSRGRGDQVPAPRSYEEIRGNDAWARDFEVDWSKSVISLVPVEASP